MNRIALVSLLTLACAAHAEPPKAETTPALPRDPVVVLNVPMPIAAVCTITPTDQGNVYARGPAYAGMSCAEFGRALQQIEARFGPGATRVDVCVPLEPCFAEQAKAAENQ